MKYNVICRKVELSDSRKEKLLGKIKKLDKFFDEELECKILVAEQKNEIVQATGTTWGIEKAAYENVWDFPQLGLQNVMVIDRQQEENLWQVGIDCIDVETQMYRGGNLDLFTPDLIYTADTEIGTVTWLTIDETCAERGMTLTDEEAVELARRLAAGVHWKKVQ